MAEVATPGSEALQARFEWSFQGRVIAVDNGAGFAGGKAFPALMKLGSLAVVSFDPTNALAERKDLEAVEEFQCVPHSTLGDGKPVTLYECLDARLSATLEPLPETLAARAAGALKVDPILARLPIASVRLDDITGLEHVDWLVLDARNDNLAILENGVRRLAHALLIEVQVPFQRDYARQADFAAVNAWMATHGFRFCQFRSLVLRTRFPTDVFLEKTQASDTRSATTVFLPTDGYLKHLSTNQLLKLSFLLHTVYRLHDLAYHVLAFVDPKLARQYLVAEGYLWPVDADEREFTLTATYSPDIWADAAS
ncbi:MAG TPA: hypothetical protein VFQ95_04450 [Rhodanobacteraceae bacterium]|nr:hypothetical protein [Rhodanobacteraceae bacterium]